MRPYDGGRRGEGQMGIPDGGGLGPRGEVQITHQNDESRRRVPIRMAVNVALLINGLTVGGYAISWLVRAQRVWDATTSPGYLSAWSATWRRLGAVWEAVAAHVGERLFLWPIPLVLEWFAPVLILIVFNLVPKLLNDEWPPAYGQADPAGGEGRTFWQWLFGRRERGEGEEDGPRKIVVEGVVRGGNGETRTRFETEYPERWQRYLRALVSGSPMLRPGFSVRAATSILFRVPREEFVEVSDQWVRIGYAAKTSGAPNARRYLTAKGEAFARGWAAMDGAGALAREGG